MVDRSILRFSPFRLDIGNQQLRRGALPIPLRPKTFAVLRHLVENAGHVVTRGELVASLWDKACGAESAPKHCVRELRVALGDRADAPRYIETVGRIGYRFIAPLAVEIAPSTAAAPAEASDGAALLPLFVGRQAELRELDGALRSALGGQRQVVFVSGEAGIGKTSVVEALLRKAGGVCIGRGLCMPQFGAGEAYFPALQALGRLTSGPEPCAVGELLARLAPSWLAQIPALLEAVPEELRNRSQGATQRRMLREIGDALEALTRETPVVLLLEDLHWGDYSSLDFIAAVAHDPRPARLLLIATYRSTEVDNDHPLRAVAPELVSRGKARSVALTGISTAAVSEYLEARFAPHEFPSALAPLLRRRTGGNPFFLVNLMDDLLAQRIVARADGIWRLLVPVDTIDSRVPENSRLLIEKQMAALPRESGLLLEAASLAGLEFGTAAIASALEIDVEAAEEQLEALARRAVFLDRAGDVVWPDSTRSAQYRFHHPLYQQLWAERVTPSRCRRLHLRLGDRLEQAHAAKPEVVAAELALHFEEGGDVARAIRYRLAAAHNAIRRSAHREALDHLTSALTRVGELADGPERDYAELGLRIALGMALTAVQGYAAPQVEETYRRSLELSDRLHDAWHIVQALLGLWPFYLVRGDLAVAQRLAERCAREIGGASDLAAGVYNVMGAAALWRGDLMASRTHLEHGLRQAELPEASVLYDATNPAVACLSHLAWVVWALGDAERGLERSREAIALARRLAHPHSLGYALTFGATLHSFRREPQRVLELAEEAMALSDEHGFPFWHAMGATLRGWALVASARNGEGLRQMRQGLAALDALGANVGRTGLLALLADASHLHGEPERSLEALRAAQGRADEGGERFYAAEIHRLRAVVMLDADDVDPAECEHSLRAAIDVARAQKAKSWELRAATSLARLRRRQGEVERAREMLRRVCRWFGEDSETPDLRDARALAAELGGR